MKAKVGNVDARLKVDGMDWFTVACLFVDDTVVLSESEKKLQRVVDEFYNVCWRRKPKANVGKSKMMISERKELEVVDLSSPYREVCQ